MYYTYILYIAKGRGEPKAQASGRDQGAAFPDAEPPATVPSRLNGRPNGPPRSR